jgi:hypothetical protein
MPNLGGLSILMPDSAFSKVQKYLEETLSELKGTKDPKLRRVLLQDMKLLVDEADRILKSAK